MVVVFDVVVVVVVVLLLFFTLQIFVTREAEIEGILK